MGRPRPMKVDADRQSRTSSQATKLVTTLFVKEVESRVYEGMQYEPRAGLMCCTFTEETCNNLQFRNISQTLCCRFLY
ncbi:hypothetical protein Mapa_013685 [Marchantia paleacea]|nr:hypothetical protein Mapa_013685 [Marchantia paleacea]